MNQKFTLAILIIGTTAVAKGQTTRHDSLQTKGKENLSIYEQGHVYDILTVDDKMVSLEFDSKRIEPADFHRYDSVLNAIKSEMRENEEHDAEDRAQERRDREQEQRDREQEQRDREQAVRDRAQEIENRKEEERDRQQEIRDREQGERDREQGQRDREQGQRDREQGERDRKEAEEERRMMRDLLDELVTEKVAPDVKSINSVVLTDTELIVNDKKQSPELQQKMKARYGKWAKRGISYGCCQDSGTTIHFSN